MANAMTSSAPPQAGIPNYGKPPKSGYLVKAKVEYPYGPNAILFKPKRVRGSEVVCVQAVCINRNGTESFASAADIASVMDRSFFQNETQVIGWERLRLWLDQRIDTYQASVWTPDQIRKHLGVKEAIVEQQTLFAP